MNHRTDEHDAEIAAVAGRLAGAGSVLFLTGAGLSADSGLPVFRGLEGLYGRGDDGQDLPIEVLLSGPMLERHPERVWGVMWELGVACAAGLPNAAHLAIAEIEDLKRAAGGSDAVWVVTQNVDPLHRYAGSRNLLEVHGHLFDLYCTVCGREDEAAGVLGGFRGRPPLPPRCPACGGVIRPAVILFEEPLDAGVVRRMEQLAKRDFDLVFVIGTTAEFGYIQDLIASVSDRSAVVVEINPGSTVVSEACDVRLRLGAAEAMRRIRAAMGPAVDRWHRPASGAGPHACALDRHGAAAG